MTRTAATRRVTRIERGARYGRADRLAAEEPLEIQVAGVPVSVTMRTPGHDFELVAGFLFAEGVVLERADLVTMRYCVGDSTHQEYNVVDVALRGGVPEPRAPLRNGLTSSACGVCGTTTISAVRASGRFDVASDDVRIAAATLAALPERLRSQQRTFDSTGGLHAAGLFTADGALVCVREDVGRHNAFDKVIGWALLQDRLPLRGHGILASGRASFELTQKALLAGIPILAAVSAPSTLAADLAAESGMTLVGFLRGDSMNVYTGEERVTP